MAKLSSWRMIPKVPPLPTTPAGFGTLVADPPWPFEDVGSRATPDYPFMDEEDILSMDVDAIRAELSHLYLWTPDTHLELALDVVKRWGFNFKHQIVWVKKEPGWIADGPMGSLQIGMGHYFRKAHEVCLFATAGKCPAAVHDLPSVIEAPRGRHSAKPEKLQDWAELLSPGPRIELFARRFRTGWRCWGGEIEAALEEEEHRCKIAA
jgi:N6-adenosine-specific RNA methylase IME4